MNIVRKICHEHGANYDKVLLGADTYGTFHKDEYTQVPGPDGKHGYGGKCFPKDLKAFEGQHQYDLFDVVDKHNEEFREEST